MLEADPKAAEIVTLKAGLREKENEVDTLKRKVNKLEKVAPKQVMIIENEALKAKASKQKGTIGSFRVETARLKVIEEKYLNMLRKYGNESQRNKDFNSKQEILEGSDDKLRDYYEHYCRQNFLEIETMNFLLVNFFDLSGDMKSQTLKKLAKFAPHGMRKCVPELQKLLVEKTTADKGMSTVVNAGDVTPKLGQIAGITKIKPNKKDGAFTLDTAAGPSYYEPSWDNFNKNLFITTKNKDCKFVRTRTVTYIAKSSDFRDRSCNMVHKLDYSKPCGIPDCNDIFCPQESFIGLVKICAPEGHKLCGKDVFVCKKHLKQSTEPIDDKEFEEAAIQMEAEAAARDRAHIRVDNEKVQPNAKKALFTEHDVAEHGEQKNPVLVANETKNSPKLGRKTHDMSPSPEFLGRGNQESDLSPESFEKLSPNQQQYLAGIYARGETYQSDESNYDVDGEENGNNGDENDDDGENIIFTNNIEDIDQNEEEEEENGNNKDDNTNEAESGLNDEM